jgi:hypothetical protein
MKFDGEGKGLEREWGSEKLSLRQKEFFGLLTNRFHFKLVFKHA